MRRRAPWPARASESWHGHRALARRAMPHPPTASTGSVPSTWRRHRRAPPGLDHPRLHRPAQGHELRRQLPSAKARRLMQRIDLAFNQRKVVRRIKDHVPAVLAARTTGNDLATAAEHHRVNGISKTCLRYDAADRDVAMATGNEDRGVFGHLAHQRLAAGYPQQRRIGHSCSQCNHRLGGCALGAIRGFCGRPAALPRGLIAGVERRCRRLRHRGHVGARRSPMVSAWPCNIFAWCLRPSRIFDTRHRSLS